MNIPFYRTIYHPFPFPSVLTSLPLNLFFDDDRLLSRRSRITNNIFERTISKPRTRSYPTRQNRQLFEISYKIHDGFTSSEERIIENALQIIANRLINPEILQNMYKICGTSGYDLEKGVWSRSQLENNKNYHGRHDLLRYQLMCLRVKGERHQFPIIHIYPIYKKTKIQGEGTADCVSCICHGSTFSIDGEFEVKLNRYHLGASDKDGSNPIYWGGVIVHEMLHNLGHDHDGLDYNRNWQINVFEKCFIYNGKYF